MNAEVLAFVLYFVLMLAIGVLFYCAMLLALSIFYNVKDLRSGKREEESKQRLD